MSRDLQKFIAGAFGLIALFLILAHFTGFAADVGSLATGGSTIFATLQGRAT
jgi:hypothetical protein